VGNHAADGLVEDARRGAEVERTCICMSTGNIFLLLDCIILPPRVGLKRVALRR
jgi:hypothetical protein